MFPGLTAVDDVNSINSIAGWFHRSMGLVMDRVEYTYIPSLSSVHCDCRQLQSTVHRKAPCPYVSYQGLLKKSRLDVSASALARVACSSKWPLGTAQDRSSKTSRICEIIQNVVTYCSTPNH